MNGIISTVWATSTASSEVPKEKSEGGIAQFGLNGWSFGFQILNFVIIFIVLQRWVFRPLMKRIQNREQKITKSLHDADTLAEHLNTIGEERKTQLEEGRKEAENIIIAAKSQAEKQAEEILQKNRENLAQIAERAKRDIHAERDRILEDTRNEITSTVLQLTEKLLTEKVDETKDRAWLEKTLANVNK